MKTLSSAFLSLMLVTGSVLGGTPADFRVEDPMGRNTVQFRTSAPLEDIVGTTNAIKGFVRVDADDLKSNGLEAEFQVDLTDLTTGIGLRDTHMKDNYLHTAEYPRATFRLTRVLKSSASRLKPDKEVRLTAEGTFELHGVTRRIRVPVRVTRMAASEATMGRIPGNLIRVQSEFDVRLADHNIERPSMVLLKVGEVAHITLDVFATDASPEMITAWMEKMKKMMGD